MSTQPAKPDHALLIGPPATLQRLEQQLDLLAGRPTTLGWVLTGPDTTSAPANAPILGRIEDLEQLIAARTPDLALVCLPAVCRDQIQSIRTTLRRLGIPDRFMPTLEDQISGVGPRLELDLDLGGLLGRPVRRIDDRAVRSIVANRRVLITGAGGSIGAELARIVMEHDPAALFLMDRAENALFDIDRQIARRAPRLERRALLQDVVDAPGTLRACLQIQPEVIFHAAAHKHVPMSEDHPGAAVDNNFFGTASIADAADAVGVDRFVMISTDKAVNPTSIMGATKRLAERYVQYINRRSRTRFSMVRFGNVLGSSGSVLETWSRQVRDGGPITVTDERMTRYFMTIPEAAALVVESAALVSEDASAGEVFLLDMGEPVRIVDLADSFVRAHGLQPILPSESTPRDAGGTISIVFSGTRPGEKLYEELAFDEEQMRETTHPGINAWMVPPPDPIELQVALDALASDRRPADPVAVAALVRAQVPEMQSADDLPQSVEIKTLGSHAPTPEAIADSAAACQARKMG